MKVDSKREMRMYVRKTFFYLQETVTSAQHSPFPFIVIILVSQRYSIVEVIRILFFRYLRSAGESIGTLPNYLPSLYHGIVIKRW